MKKCQLCTCAVWQPRSKKTVCFNPQSPFFRQSIKFNDTCDFFVNKEVIFDDEIYL